MGKLARKEGRVIGLDSQPLLSISLVELILLGKEGIPLLDLKSCFVCLFEFGVNTKCLKGSSYTLFWALRWQRFSFTKWVPSFGSFVKMAAPESHGDSDCGASPHKAPPCSYVLPLHSGRHAGQRLHFPTKEGRLAWTPRSTSAKMVAARRHRSLPRWRREASGTRFPNQGSPGGRSGRGGRPGSPSAARAASGCSRAPGRGMSWSRGSLRSCHKCQVLSPVGASKLLPPQPKATPQLLSPTPPPPRP